MKRIGLILTAGVLMLLSSCSLVQQQAPESDSGTAASAEKQKKKATAPKNDKNVQPTPAQMEAAVQVLQENITTAAAAPESIPDAEPAPQTDVIPGGLRMGRFAPPEEAVSSSDNDMPAPNSVELHGFRSPNLKGGTLPMNINGKINKPE